LNKNKILKSAEYKAIEDRIITNGELKVEKKISEDETFKNRRNFIRSTDKRVFNFELKLIAE
jgi:hypothetical protein